MDIVRTAINRPVSVAVGVLLVVMFGLIGLTAIPIQLTPTVDRPIVTVSTSWPGRSPQEMVDEITREQEKQLKNVSNLRSMRSTSREGEAEIVLEFYLGADINRALQEVSDALRQVPDYPDEVNEPTIKAADGASENAIAWIIVDLPPEKAALHPDFDITTLFDPLDKEVKPFLERIDGVAEVNVYGGREREVRVMLDPTALAQRQLNHLDVIEALRAENRNVSAGTIAEGKRDYRVRVVGQFVTAQDILDTIVAYRDGKPVYVRDVGTAEIGHTKRRGFVRALGSPSIAINVIRQSGANVMDIMEELRARLDEVRTDILPRLHPTVGPDLRLRQVYDETTYIDSAIDLVMDNLLFGGILAASVLLLFLRSFVATTIISVAIPISVIGTFLAMVAFGRTLNVISLAGLAFATGMVVDNAVVVLENIYRRLQEGDSPLQAAYRGGKEVWGAVLASTLTTVAVFVPVLTIQEEAGQLFRDISLAIACAVALSLIVSVTVVPAAAALFVNRTTVTGARQGRLARAWRTLFGIAPLLARVVQALADTLYWVMTGWRAWSVRPALIVLMAVASIWASFKLMPPLDYLPQGNRNLVFGGLLIPPGYSVEQQEEIATRIEAQLRPYVEADPSDPASMAALQPIPRGFPGMPGAPAPFDPVPIDNFFIGAFRGGMFMGATSAIEEVVIPVGQLLTNAMNTIPDAFGGAQQSSIFGMGIGAGNTVDLEISGPRIDRVLAAANMMVGTAMGMADTFGPGRVRPNPSNFNLSQPEVQIRLNALGRELGLTTRDVGTAVRGLFDGAFVDDFRLASDTVDLVVVPEGGRLEYKEQLAGIPIATPSGKVVPLDTVVEVVPGLAQQEIQRIEELPAVSIQFTPPAGMTVEEVMNVIRERIVAPAEAAGLIDHSMRLRMEGTAAKLDEVRSALFGKAEPSAIGGWAGLAAWQKGLIVVSLLLAAAGAAVGLYAVLRAVRGRRVDFVYAGMGALLLALVIGGLLSGVAWQPQFVTARFIWALAVTYLLMCSLYESFVHPFVIMFSVPLAVVGGFAGLRIVHEMTLADPTIAPQQLDVLTMLGFVILIGTVVNNAILIVEQSLNFMRPSEFGDEPLPPLKAIAESVRTRMRPIFMTTCTTLGGMLPLVVAPGAGSEMYRGLGAVVLGGLLVSTLFTLVLVPLTFSLSLQMNDGLRALFGLKSALEAERERAATTEPLAPSAPTPPAPRPEPRELQPV